MKKTTQFVVLLTVWMTCVTGHSASAQNVNESPEDADRATVVKAILSELISQRKAKQPQPPLNIARGSVDAKLFPSKVGDVDIFLVSSEEIEKQEEFIFFEFENFRLKRNGLEAVIGKVWQTCSGYSGHNRYIYSYRRVGDKWEGGWDGEVHLESYHGRSPCRKK